MIPFDVQKIWVLVANRSSAKIYSSSRNIKTLKAIEEIQNPEGRLQDKDIYSDKQGRGFAEVGESRYAYDRTASGPEKNAEDFASKLAERLKQAVSRGEFDGLFLVMEPQSLGLLRSRLDKAVESRVLHTVSKDFIPLDPQEQLEALKSVVEAA